MSINGPGVPDETFTPRFTASGAVPAGVPVLGVPVFSDLTIPAGAGAEVDAAYLRQRRFDGKPGQAQALLADDGTTVVAIGVGEKGSVGPDDLRRAAAALARGAGQADHVATTLVAALNGADPERSAVGARAVVEGLGLGSYRYAGAPKRKLENGRVERFTVVGAREEDVRQAQAAVEATLQARDWVNRPPRDLTPRELARLAERAGRAAGLRVEVWDEQRIARERLGGLMGVSSGAAEPPRLIRLEHRAARRAPSIHLVGKGITFDSGGLSLKPPASMMTMKCDMGGAAAVINATLAAARLRVPVNVVCWVAATENMPSGTAIHPGDVLTARNGKTVEVLNTDAEGRLVLADALSLAVEAGADAIIDAATLTGAQRVALGDGVAAVMGTDADLVRRVIEAGQAAGEPFWELPLHAPYRKNLDSEVADIKNIGGGPAAGSIMAGLFLKEFVGDRPWAHLDIAAPAFLESGDDGWLSKGATGWGTRTLLELVRTW
ncbi:MAG TPA: leucyl aminopeptidase [Acidimicrobiales bacterium]|nr:leucyl aminopeptidase [Acidimicrobiales bacterium]